MSEVKIDLSELTSIIKQKTHLLGEVQQLEEHLDVERKDKSKLEQKVKRLKNNEKLLKKNILLLDAKLTRAMGLLLTAQ